MDTKYCPKCRDTKATDEFARNKARPDGLAASCKKCNSDYKKLHYAVNKDKVVAKVKARKQELIDKCWKYKSEHACADCGLVDPVVMEFDHISDKTMGIAEMVQQGYSWDNVLKEIEKCELVCANCHRRRTHTRAGWVRNINIVV